jgi:hypothetical protein
MSNDQNLRLKRALAAAAPTPPPPGVSADTLELERLTTVSPTSELVRRPVAIKAIAKHLGISRPSYYAWYHPADGLVSQEKADAFRRALAELGRSA